MGSMEHSKTVHRTRTGGAYQSGLSSTLSSAHSSCILVPDGDPMTSTTESSLAAQTSMSCENREQSPLSILDTRHLTMVSPHTASSDLAQKRTPGMCVVSRTAREGFVTYHKREHRRCRLNVSEGLGSRTGHCRGIHLTSGVFICDLSKALGAAARVGGWSLCLDPMGQHPASRLVSAPQFTGRYEDAFSPSNDARGLLEQMRNSIHVLESIMQESRSM